MDATEEFDSQDESSDYEGSEESSESFGATAALRKYIEDNNIKDDNSILAQYLRNPWGSFAGGPSAETVLSSMLCMQDKELSAHFLKVCITIVGRGWEVVRFIAIQCLGDGRFDDEFEKWFIDKFFEVKMKSIVEEGDLEELHGMLRVAFELGCSLYFAKAFLRHGAVPTPCYEFCEACSEKYTTLFAPLIPLDRGCCRSLERATEAFYSLDRHKREAKQGYDCIFFNNRLRRSIISFEELAVMTVSDMAALEQLHLTALPSDVIVHCIAPYLALVGAISTKRSPKKRL